MKTEPNQQELEKIDVRKLVFILYDKAKILWGWSYFLKIIILIVALINSYNPMHRTTYLILALIIAIASEILNWNSSNIYSGAEKLQRELDLHNSLGWAVSKKSLIDLLADVDAKTYKKVRQKEGDVDTFFSSTEMSGPQKALDNLCESSWWSYKLSQSMFKICLVVCILSFILSVGLLVSASYFFSDSYSAITRFTQVGLVFMGFILSFGTLKLIKGYYFFSKKSNYIHISVTEFKKLDDCSEIDVYKLWSNYHVSRNSAPPIPTWIWRKKRDRLNELWEIYQS